MSEKIFHKKRVTRCGDSEGTLLDRFTQLVIENNAIDYSAMCITDEAYLEMEQFEKQIESAIKLQELVKKDIKDWEDDPDFDKDYLTKEVSEYVNLVDMISKSEK